MKSDELSERHALKEKEAAKRVKDKSRASSHSRGERGEKKVCQGIKAEEYENISVEVGEKCVTFCLRFESTQSETDKSQESEQEKEREACRTIEILRSTRRMNSPKTGKTKVRVECLVNFNNRSIAILRERERERGRR